MKNLNKSNMKNALICIMLGVAMVACEGNADPGVDNYGIDAKEMAKTRASIDSLPEAIKKDYLKSDSLIHYDMKKEIEVLRKEVADLRAELKKKK
ncbi:MAG TPA: hypothetical protein VNW06_03365 [Cytophagaceae bacterium]|jgi:hypothetical protein|nr:hypothetical protein [Cytophagaceae bacterium]